MRPAIGRLAGRDDASLAELSVRLAKEFSHRGDRPTYHPARLAAGSVEPLKWHGSADLRTLVEADALVCFEAGDRHYKAGSQVRVLKLP